MRSNALTNLSISNFTAFTKLDLEFSPGVNIFIGANATGKTHLLKVLYSGCETSWGRETWQQKLVEVFLPSQRQIGRLVRHGASKARIELRAGNVKGGTSIMRSDTLPMVSRPADASWYKTEIESCYIPSKEILANAPGFVALQSRRETHFEGIFTDIVARASTPELKPSEIGPALRRLLGSIQETIKGKVVNVKEEFYLSWDGWKLEYTLLAEGLRKLGLLWVLIRNGSIREGSILFWDEPEANLNPSLMRKGVEIILALQRIGVQVFLATHHYVLLKEFDLQAHSTDRVRYHSLFHDPDTGNVMCKSTDQYQSIDPNLIVDTLADLYDRDVERDFSDAAYLLKVE